MHLYSESGFENMLRSQKIVKIVKNVDFFI